MAEDVLVTYKVGESIYQIPASNQEKLLEKYPDAERMSTFNYGGEDYYIPNQNAEKFISKYPDAEPMDNDANIFMQSYRGKQNRGIPTITVTEGEENGLTSTLAESEDVSQKPKASNGDIATPQPVNDTFFKEDAATQQQNIAKDKKDRAIAEQIYNTFESKPELFKTVEAREKFYDLLASKGYANAFSIGESMVSGDSRFDQRDEKESYIPNAGIDYVIGRRRHDDIVNTPVMRDPAVQLKLHTTFTNAGEGLQQTINTLNAGGDNEQQRSMAKDFSLLQTRLSSIQKAEKEGRINTQGAKDAIKNLSDAAANIRKKYKNYIDGVTEEGEQKKTFEEKITGESIEGKKDFAGISLDTKPTQQKVKGLSKDAREKVLSTLDDIESLYKKFSSVSAQSNAAYVNRPENQYQLATALSEMGKFKESNKILGELLNKNAASYQIYQAAAYNYYQLGDNAAARSMQIAAQQRQPISDIPSNEGGDTTGLDMGLGNPANPQYGNQGSPTPASEEMGLIAGALRHYTPLYSNAANISEGWMHALEKLKKGGIDYSKLQQAKNFGDVVKLGVGEGARTALNTIAGFAEGLFAYSMNTTPVGLAFVEGTQGLTAEGAKATIGKVGAETFNYFRGLKGSDKVTPDEAVAAIMMPVTTVLQGKEMRGAEIPEWAKDVGLISDVIAMHLFMGAVSRLRGTEEAKTAQDILDGKEVTVEHANNLIYSIIKMTNEEGGVIYKIQHEYAEKLKELEKTVADFPETREVLQPEIEATNKKLEDIQGTLLHHDILTESSRVEIQGKENALSALKDAIEKQKEGSAAKPLLEERARQLQEEIDGLEAERVQKTKDAVDAHARESFAKLADEVLDIRFGDYVDYGGIKGRVERRPDGVVVVTPDGKEVLVEGGFSGKRLKDLGLKKIEEPKGGEPKGGEPKTEPQPETEVEQGVAEVKAPDVKFNFEENTVTVDGKKYTYDGVGVDKDGNTTSIRVIDENGNVRHLRNEEVVFEIELQKETAELGMIEKSEVEAAAKELNIKEQKNEKETRGTPEKQQGVVEKLQPAEQAKAVEENKGEQKQEQLKTQDDAVQEQKTKGVDVRQQAADGEAVGERNAKGQEITDKGEAEKIKKQIAEENAKSEWQKEQEAIDNDSSLSEEEKEKKKIESTAKALDDKYFEDKRVGKQKQLELIDLIPKEQVDNPSTNGFYRVSKMDENLVSKQSKEAQENIKKLNDIFKEKNREDVISEAYHKAKADGSNPELVKAVEELIGKPKEAKSEQKAEKPTEQKPTIEQQVKTFGVAEKLVKPVVEVANALFSGLKKAGLVAKESVEDWLNIGKADKVDENSLDGFIDAVKKELPKVEKKESKIQSWLDKWNKLKKQKDLKELDLFYNKVKVALNGYAQGKGVEAEFKELKKDIEDYAEKLKQEQEPKVSSTTEFDTKKQPINKLEDLQDVGEKIGGAKKDLAQALSEVTKEDIESKPLSKIFPRPDFKKLVAEGSLSQDAAILLNFIYDNIPAKPRKSYRLASWTKTVQGALETTQQVLEAESSKNTDFVDKIRKAVTLSETLKRDYEIYSETLKGLGFPNEPVNLGGYKIRKFESGTQSKLNKETGKLEPVLKDLYTIVNDSFIIKDFDTMEEAINGLKAILNNKGTKSEGTKFDIYQSRKTKEYFIGKKGAIDVVRLVDGFKTVKEARDFLTEKQAELQAMWDAMKAPKERRMANRQRVGIDWRKGENITSNKFQETFGFRGVEFGNWVNNAERQAHVNEAYDALMDLASVLGISPKALSLNGELGFAFGARGSGKANAHYEAGKVVINLTKTRGAGSLAHEWWHALDNYFSRARNQKTGYITERPRDLINRDGSRVEGVRKEMIDAFKSVMDAIGGSKLKDRSMVLDKTRSEAYWSTPIEMSARSFENYIIEKLAERNQQNDYLANLKSTEEWIKDAGSKVDATKNYPYPLKEESHSINEKFQQFFETIKEDESGKLYQIIGEVGAENLPKIKANLDVARQMEAGGKTPKEIWLATGWERTKDKGKWKYDLPDVNYTERLQNYIDRQGNGYENWDKEFVSKNNRIPKLKDIFGENSELFEAYPELKDVAVVIHPKQSALGTWNTKEKFISVNQESVDNSHNIKSTIIHEIQHAIQDIEGFAKGGNQETAPRLKMDALQDIRSKIKELNIDPYKIQNQISMKYKISDDILDKYRKWQELKELEDGVLAEIVSPYEAYKRLAGEVEARNAQKRLTMAHGQRKEQMLSETEDVAEDSKIYIYGANEVMESRKPFGGNSGYVGYSMSRRAAQAYDDGKLTYSKLPAWAKRMVDAEGKNYTTQHSIEITPELKAAAEKGMPLFQNANAQYRIKAGEHIVEALKDFDGSPKAVTAIVHEFMHPTVVEIFNGAKEGNETGVRHANTIVEEYNKANPSKKVTLNQMIDGNDSFINGRTTPEYRAVQEFIAEAWEKYHHEGAKGFSKAFQEALDAITEAFRQVYKSLTGVTLTPELRKMFDELLGMEEVKQEQKQEKPAIEKTLVEEHGVAKEDAAIVTSVLDKLNKGLQSMGVSFDITKGLQLGKGKEGSEASAHAQFRIDKGKRIVEILKSDLPAKEKATAVLHEVGHLSLHELLQQHIDGSTPEIKKALDTMIKAFNESGRSGEAKKRLGGDVTIEKLIEEHNAFKEQGEKINAASTEALSDNIPNFRDFHEFITDSLNKYLKDGTAGFGKEFDAVLQKIKELLVHVYDTVRGGTLEGLTVSPELKQVFDRMLGKDVDLFKEPEKPQAKPLGEVKVDMPTTDEQGRVMSLSEALRMAKEQGQIKGKETGGLKHSEGMSEADFVAMYQKQQQDNLRAELLGAEDVDVAHTAGEERISQRQRKWKAVTVKEAKKIIEGLDPKYESTNAESVNSLVDRIFAPFQDYIKAGVDVFDVASEYAKSIYPKDRTEPYAAQKAAVATVLMTKAANELRMGFRFADSAAAGSERGVFKRGTLEYDIAAESLKKFEDYLSGDKRVDATALAFANSHINPNEVYALLDAIDNSRKKVMGEKAKSGRTKEEVAKEMRTLKPTAEEVDTAAEKATAKTTKVKPKRSLFSGSTTKKTRSTISVERKKSAKDKLKSGLSKIQAAIPSAKPTPKKGGLTEEPPLPKGVVEGVKDIAEAAISEGHYTQEAIKDYVAEKTKGILDRATSDGIIDKAWDGEIKQKSGAARADEVSYAIVKALKTGKGDAITKQLGEALLMQDAEYDPSSKTKRQQATARLAEILKDPAAAEARLNAAINMVVNQSIVNPKMLDYLGLDPVDFLASKENPHGMTMEQFEAFSRDMLKKKLYDMAQDFMGHGVHEQRVLPLPKKRIKPSASEVKKFIKDFYDNPEMTDSMLETALTDHFDITPEQATAIASKVRGELADIVASRSQKKIDALAEEISDGDRTKKKRVTDMVVKALTTNGAFGDIPFSEKMAAALSNRSVAPADINKILAYGRMANATDSSLLKAFYMRKAATILSKYDMSAASFLFQGLYEQGVVNILGNPRTSILTASLSMLKTMPFDVVRMFVTRPSTFVRAVRFSKLIGSKGIGSVTGEGFRAILNGVETVRNRAEIETKPQIRRESANKQARLTSWRYLRKASLSGNDPKRAQLFILKALQSLTFSGGSLRQNIGGKTYEFSPTHWLVNLISGLDVVVKAGLMNLHNYYNAERFIRESGIKFGTSEFTKKMSEMLTTDPLIFDAIDKQVNMEVADAMKNGIPLPKDYVHERKTQLYQEYVDKDVVSQSLFEINKSALIGIPRTWLGAHTYNFIRSNTEIKDNEKTVNAAVKYIFGSALYFSRVGINVIERRGRGIPFYNMFLAAAPYEFTIDASGKVVRRTTESGKVIRRVENKRDFAFGILQATTTTALAVMLINNIFQQEDLKDEKGNPVIDPATGEPVKHWVLNPSSPIRFHGRKKALTTTEKNAVPAMCIELTNVEDPDKRFWKFEWFPESWYPMLFMLGEESDDIRYKEEKLQVGGTEKDNSMLRSVQEEPTSMFRIVATAGIGAFNASFTTPAQTADEASRLISQDKKRDAAATIAYRLTGQPFITTVNPRLAGQIADAYDYFKEREKTYVKLSIENTNIRSAVSNMAQYSMNQVWAGRYLVNNEDNKYTIYDAHGQPMEREPGDLLFLPAMFSEDMYYGWAEHIYKSPLYKIYMDDNGNFDESVIAIPNRIGWNDKVSVSDMVKQQVRQKTREYYGQLVTKFYGKLLSTPYEERGEFIKELWKAAVNEAKTEYGAKEKTVEGAVGVMQRKNMTDGNAKEE